MLELRKKTRPQYIDQLLCVTMDTPVAVSQFQSISYEWRFSDMGNTQFG